MKRSDAIDGLRQRADAMQAMGVTGLYLFGSTGRDEARPDSDLDVFIDTDPSRRLSLIDLIGIKHFLEDALSTEVDITLRAGLHPLLKADIEQSAIRVF
jgi:predicted nucleotidyltransferase